MKILKTCVFVVVFAAAPVVLGGCGGGGGSSSTGLTISGTAWDLSFSPPVPAAGATVTLRKADNSAIAETTTASDGSYTLTNVPASTDVYLNVSKPTYASFNDEIINITTDLADRQLWIASATNVQYTVDLITGNTGTISTWSNPFYTGQSWFTMDIYDASGNEVPGIYVTADPTGPTILYNNGLDVFLPDGPTATLTTHASANLVGGYNPSTGVYTFILTDGSTIKTVKLPLVQGEMTYVAVYPW